MHDTPVVMHDTPVVMHDKQNGMCTSCPRPLQPRPPAPMLRNLSPQRSCSRFRHVYTDAYVDDYGRKVGEAGFMPPGHVGMPPPGRVPANMKLGPLTAKVTTGTVNRKLKELKQEQAISTHTYHPNKPVHESQRMFVA